MEGATNASSGAADVHEHAAALAPHMRKHGAIHANRAKKIRIHEMLRLFGGDSLRQPEREIRALAEKDSLPISVLSLDVTNDARSNGL